MRLIFDNKEFIPSNASPLEVMTKEQYKNLTPEEKEGSFFLVESRTPPTPLQYAQEVYSTEETRIGTWIDGKPLYRIVISGQLGNDIDFNYTLVEIQNLKDVVSCHGSVYRTSYETFFTQDAIPNKFCEIGSLGNLIQIRPQDNIMLNAKYNIVVEYTKTTD